MIVVNAVVDMAVDVLVLSLLVNHPLCNIVCFLLKSLEDCVIG